MDVISDIINEARANRIMLYIRDGQLAFMAEEGRFPEELRFQIGKYREEIRRALLRGQPEESPRVEYPPSQQTADSSHPESAESFDLTPTIARVQEILWPVRNYDSALLLQVPAGLTRDVLLAVLQTVLEHHGMLRLQVTDENGVWKLRVRAKKSVAFLAGVSQTRRKLLASPGRTVRAFSWRNLTKRAELAGSVRRENRESDLVRFGASGSGSASTRNQPSGNGRNVLASSDRRLESRLRVPWQ